jgi:hypothetical protein
MVDGSGRTNPPRPNYQSYPPPGKNIPGYIPPGGSGTAGYWGGGGGGIPIAPGTGGLGGMQVGPTSDPRIAAHFWPSAKINPDTLPKGTNGAWRSFTVDRPTILVVSQGIILDQFSYCPERIGDCATITGGVSVPASSTGLTRGDQVFSATRHGCCYFSAPGIWWVYNPSSTVDYQVWLVDASDPSVAQRYLNEPAACVVSNTTNVTVATGTTLLANANRARSATMIQHTGRDSADAASSNDVFIAFEASAVLGQGMFLGNLQTIVLQNDINYRSRIRAIARTAAVKVAVTEFFA